MKDIWSKAAANYADPPSKRRVDTTQPVRPPVVDPAEKARKEAEFKSEVANAAKALEEFLAGEDGKAAMALLLASQEDITFYFQQGGGGGGDDDVMLTAGGLVGHDGNGKIYPSAAYAVEHACFYIESLKRKPSKVLPWIIKELNKIAKRAPK